MSDFVSHDILPDLWEEILQRHWTFLETEESIQKLEERKKLEGCLKEFLCIVPHDRKFFLPETSHVLRKSILEMDDFTAYKAIVGFEAISQYANNLFTKPWRKEYRVLKTYSGYYHHEVKLNLLDADKMLEAMGYRRVSNEVLVLDGPICPDQVTNVSRDAMAAYVECQIIKSIYSELLKLGVNCSWQDVYHYRETHVGGTTQAIKALAYSIQERRSRKEKPYNSNDACYSNVQELQQQCLNCGPYQQRPQNQQMSHIQQPMVGPCAIHGNNMYSVNSSNFGNKLTASYPTANNYMPSVCTQQHPQMTHSRSLEHYNEPHAMLPHRHSFDHQQQGCTAHHYQQLQPIPQHLYESPYDCIDGTSLGSTASYSMVADATANNCTSLNPTYAHPYNVSGNRVPLPYNISNQLNTSHFGAQQNVTCNGVNGTSDGYANIMDNTNNYATISKKNNCNVHNQIGASGLSGSRQLFNAKEIQAIKQRPLPPDQLIDFDDKAGLLGHDYIAHNLHTSPAAYDCERKRMYDGRGDMGGASANVPIYSQPILNTERQMPAPSQTVVSTSGNYEYARPVPRSSRVKQSSNMNPQTQMMAGENVLLDKRFRNKEVLQDFDNNLQLQTELNTAINNLTLHPSTSRRKVSAHTNERDLSDHTSYDSPNLDDYGAAYHRNNQLQRSPTQAVKNQDGVGSYESWNYVFQNLERSGYTKDLGEREDLLVKGLDFRTKRTESPNATATPNTEQDKRREVNSTTNSVDKSKANQERIPASTTANTASTGATRKIVKSALKSPKTTTNSQAPTSSTDNKFANNNMTTTKSNSINNNMTTNSNSTNLQSNGVRKSSQQKVPPPVSTQVIVTGPNEWSCQYCTFLNPNSKRVCEMCCRSKDFQLDAVVISHTPTCV